MDKDGAAKTDLSTRILEAVAIVAPVIAVAAFILFLGTRDDGGAGAVAAPPPATDALPRSASAAGEEAAFADPVSEPGSNPGSGGKAEDPSGNRAQSAAVAPVTESEAAPAAASRIVTVRNGEAVEVRDAPGGDVVAKQGDETEFGSPSVFAVRRQKRGWVGVSTPLVANDELGWIRADRRDLRAGEVDHSVVVDLSKRSSRLFYGGTRIRSWKVTVGAPGTETPVGRFAVTDTFRGGLNPAYGCCAVALTATQPNLPSGWLGGNRIAFHGTDGPLGVAASTGCLRSADRDVSALVRSVPLGTPVRIRE